MTISSSNGGAVAAASRDVHAITDDVKSSASLRQVLLESCVLMMPDPLL